MASLLLGLFFFRRKTMKQLASDDWDEGSDKFLIMPSRKLYTFLAIMISIINQTLLSTLRAVISTMKNVRFLDATIQ